jgi:hypothetical protein
MLLPFATDNRSGCTSTQYSTSKSDVPSAFVSPLAASCESIACLICAYRLISVGPNRRR